MFIVDRWLEWIETIEHGFRKKPCSTNKCEIAVYVSLFAVYKYCTCFAEHRVTLAHLGRRHDALWRSRSNALLRRDNECRAFAGASIRNATQTRKPERRGSA